MDQPSREPRLLGEDPNGPRISRQLGQHLPDDDGSTKSLTALELATKQLRHAASGELVPHQVLAWLGEGREGRRGVQHDRLAILAGHAAFGNPWRAASIKSPKSPNSSSGRWTLGVWSVKARGGHIV